MDTEELGPEVEPEGVPEALPTPKEDDPDAQLPPGVAQQLPAFDPKLLNPFGTGGSTDVLPGYKGLPFRGEIPDLKEQDTKPKIAYLAKVNILDLKDKDQLEAYKNIYQMVVNGYAEIGKEELQYDPKTREWKVFIRWWQAYTHNSKR